MRCAGGELIISGTGIINNSGVLQTFGAGESGRIIFNNTSTAGHATIINGGELNGPVAAKPSSMIHRLPKAQPLSLTEGFMDASGGIVFNGSRLVARRG